MSINKLRQNERRQPIVEMIKFLDEAKSKFDKKGNSNSRNKGTTSQKSLITNIKKEYVRIKDSVNTSEDSTIDYDTIYENMDTIDPQKIEIEFLINYIRKQRKAQEKSINKFIKEYNPKDFKKDIDDKIEKIKNHIENEDSITAIEAIEALQALLHENQYARQKFISTLVICQKILKIFQAKEPEFSKTGVTVKTQSEKVAKLIKQCNAYTEHGIVSALTPTLKNSIEQYKQELDTLTQKSEFSINHQQALFTEIDNLHTIINAHNNHDEIAEIINRYNEVRVKIDHALQTYNRYQKKLSGIECVILTANRLSPFESTSVSEINSVRQKYSDIDLQLQLVISTVHEKLTTFNRFNISNAQLTLDEANKEVVKYRELHNNITTATSYFKECLTLLISKTKKTANQNKKDETIRGDELIVKHKESKYVSNNMTIAQMLTVLVNPTPGTTAVTNPWIDFINNLPEIRASINGILAKIESHIKQSIPESEGSSGRLSAIKASLQTLSKDFDDKNQQVQQLMNVYELIQKLLAQKDNPKFEIKKWKKKVKKILGNSSAHNKPTTTEQAQQRLQNLYQGTLTRSKTKQLSELKRFLGETNAKQTLNSLTRALSDDKPNTDCKGALDAIFSATTTNNLNQTSRLIHNLHFQRIAKYLLVIARLNILSKKFQSPLFNFGEIRKQLEQLNQDEKPSNSETKPRLPRNSSADILSRALSEMEVDKHEFDEELLTALSGCVYSTITVGNDQSIEDKLSSEMIKNGERITFVEQSNRYFIYYGNQNDQLRHWELEADQVKPLIEGGLFDSENETLITNSSQIKIAQSLSLKNRVKYHTYQGAQLPEDVKNRVLNNKCIILFHNTEEKSYYACSRSNKDSSNEPTVNYHKILNENCLSNFCFSNSLQEIAKPKAITESSFQIYTGKHFPQELRDQLKPDPSATKQSSNDGGTIVFFKQTNTKTPNARYFIYYQTVEGKVSCLEIKHNDIEQLPFKQDVGKVLFNPKLINTAKKIYKNIENNILDLDSRFNPKEVTRGKAETARVAKDLDITDYQFNNKAPLFERVQKKLAKINEQKLTIKMTAQRQFLEIALDTQHEVVEFNESKDESLGSPNHNTDLLKQVASMKSYKDDLLEKQKTNNQIINKLNDRLEAIKVAEAGDIGSSLLEQSKVLQEKIGQAKQARNEYATLLQHRISNTQLQIQQIKLKIESHIKEVLSPQLTTISSHQSESAKLFNRLNSLQHRVNVLQTNTFKSLEKLAVSNNPQQRQYLLERVAKHLSVLESIMDIYTSVSFQLRENHNELIHFSEFTSANNHFIDECNATKNKVMASLNTVKQSKQSVSNLTAAIREQQSKYLNIHIPYFNDLNNPSFKDSTDIDRLGEIRNFNDAQNTAIKLTSDARNEVFNKLPKSTAKPDKYISLLTETLTNKKLQAALASNELRMPRDITQNIIDLYLSAIKQVKDTASSPEAKQQASKLLSHLNIAEIENLETRNELNEAERNAILKQHINVINSAAEYYANDQEFAVMLAGCGIHLPMEMIKAINHENHQMLYRSIIANPIIAKLACEQKKITAHTQQRRSSESTPITDDRSHKHILHTIQKINATLGSTDPNIDDTLTDLLIDLNIVTDEETLKKIVAYNQSIRSKVLADDSHTQHASERIHQADIFTQEYDFSDISPLHTEISNAEHEQVMSKGSNESVKARLVENMKKNPVAAVGTAMVLGAAAFKLPAIALVATVGIGMNSIREKRRERRLSSNTSAMFSDKTTGAKPSGTMSLDEAIERDIEIYRPN